MQKDELNVLSKNSIYPLVKLWHWTDSQTIPSFSHIEFLSSKKV